MCGRTYRQRNSLYDHRKIHRGLGKCHICGKVSSKPANLKAHMLNVHGGAQAQLGALPIRASESADQTTPAVAGSRVWQSVPARHAEIVTQAEQIGAAPSGCDMSS